MLWTVSVGQSDFVYNSNFVPVLYFQELLLCSCTLWRAQGQQVVSSSPWPLWATVWMRNIRKKLESVRINSCSSLHTAMSERKKCTSFLWSHTEEKKQIVWIFSVVRGVLNFLWLNIKQSYTSWTVPIMCAGGAFVRFVCVFYNWPSFHTYAMEQYGDTQDLQQWHKHRELGLSRNPTQG